MTQETSNRENIILNNFNVISVYKGNVNFIPQRRPSCLYAIKLHVLTSVLVLCVVNKQKYVCLEVGNGNLTISFYRPCENFD